MNYLTLSVSDVVAEFGAMARDAESVFGKLSERQLNWRPDATRWSVAQCFDHLLAANRLMFQSMDAALDPQRPTSLLQRVPVLPRLYGRMMISSLSPQGTRRLTAPRPATPAASAIDPAIIGRFVASQDEAARRVRAFGSRDVDRIVMVSPFTSLITYSVLDGCRIVAAHQRRHFEQARRVTETPGFPPPA